MYVIVGYNYTTLKFNKHMRTFMKVCFLQQKNKKQSQTIPPEKLHKCQVLSTITATAFV